jgi:hypothetical protein
VESSRIFGKTIDDFNTTFIALIPKDDNSTSLEKLRPISLCNCIHKLISKLIARRLKRILSRHILDEKFGFLEGCQINEVAGVAQEVLHSIKVNNIRLMVVKVNLSKDYDRVSWLYIRLILYHIGIFLYSNKWGNIFLFKSKKRAKTGTPPIFFSLPTGC